MIIGGNTVKKLNKALTVSILASSMALSPLTAIHAQSTHTVQSGEYLLKIANDYGVSVDDLRAWNGLSSDWLVVGQTLSVSGPSQSAPSTSSSSSQRQSTSGVHIVQSGDTLWGIANAYGISYADIVAWNGAKSWLNVGDQVVLNGSSYNAQPAPVQSSAPVTTTNASGYHTVQSGDTLWDIANAYGVSYFDIMAYNGMSSDWLNVGDQIAIPGYAAAPSNSQTSNATSTEEASDSEETTTEETTTEETSTEESKDIKDLREMSKEELEKYYEELPEAARPKKHKIVEGDTIESIATQYNFSQNSIREWNELADEALTVGEEIYVSNPRYVPDVYEVAEGDSLESIAQTYEVTVADLDEWNNLGGNSPEVGSKLVVSEPAARQYQPKAGENLEDIAKKFGITKEQLFTWNELPETAQFYNGVLKVVDPEGVTFEETNTEETTLEGETTVIEDTTVEETSAQ